MRGSAAEDGAAIVSAGFGRRMRAGAPTAVDPSGTSPSTTEFAPIVHPAPIFDRPTITASVTRQR